MAKEVNINNLPELLSITQACQVLGVHPNTLRNWDKEGRLKAIRIGVRKDRRYKKEDILRMLRVGLKEVEAEEKFESLEEGFLSRLGYLFSSLVSSRFLVTILWILVVGLLIYAIVILLS